MRPVNAIITKVVDETPTIRTFFLDTSFELIPGQFVMVWVRGVDEIPMALSYDNAITVQKVGPATSALFELDVCDSVGIRGPFGNGFDIKKGYILLVAGGVGAAPLAPLAERADSMGIRVVTLLGARTKDELLFRERFEAAGEVRIATDDGSAGKHGYVTQMLDNPESFDQIYCCGPEIMMKRVLDTVAPSKAQFSLHRYIKCGIGICGACCVDGLRVCRDGPVFPGEVLKKTEFGVYGRNECGERVKI
ncbi:2-polyprenylphenol hydroxylase-like oxidoreductase [Candidatus Methanoperedens nitroreducens]|uniref:Probable dihydroorotate dehydrogenase B (NAD(+)), electron transfer subunit n=1 Tax=Candidatus Methanoperedens nitratireducens TaxID=1392998 RepID=A0A062VAA2_9EURY|nr:dihydroorotate dehydrogenase electron transfer subunit [Candidatus Methanoperedens nitroreducens]KCZ72659.1 2-polyprenylphenol hydroxylase-like oxidoreductase [Candidatus Methanoperedens nitroreducens]MDJ1423409.1 dihydroorotate dehydrogenase electron transfer subunit [Candidatus Methanoperedens sp.]